MVVEEDAIVGMGEGREASGKMARWQWQDEEMSLDVTMLRKNTAVARGWPFVCRGTPLIVDRNNAVAQLQPHC